VHHQKSVVVGTDEGLIGFCGGMDFAFADGLIQNIIWIDLDTRKQ